MCSECKNYVSISSVSIKKVGGRMCLHNICKFSVSLNSITRMRATKVHVVNRSTLFVCKMVSLMARRSFEKE